MGIFTSFSAREIFEIFIRNYYNKRKAYRD